MDCSTPGLPVHHQLPKFIQTHAHWVGDAIQPSHPLPSPSPAFNLSQHQGVFQWVSSSHQMDKILEFQPQHQYFQWIFRIDFLKDELDGSSCSPRHSAFIVQLSHPYMTTRKTIAFVSKVMSLLFNMLSRLVIAFLLRSKHLLISAAVTIWSDFGASQNKVCHCFHCFPIYLSWHDGTGCHDLSFLNVDF